MASLLTLYLLAVAALREIKRLQKSTQLLIPAGPFSRLVREVIENTGVRTVTRLQAPALHALQEASEAFLINWFYMCQHLALHAKRVTVMPSDAALVRKLGLAGTVRDEWHDRGIR